MKTNKRLLIMAILFGLITVVALNYYLRSLEKPAMDAIPQTSVVVARSTIPAHTRIQAEMLETRTIPAVAVHPEAIRNTTDIVGGISRTEIITGEQILSHRVFTEERRISLSYRIPEGMRAIAIPVGDVSGVAGYISPGDRIDIILTFENDEVNDTLTTYTYFQNMTVLATGSETRERDTEDQGIVNSLTLLATPEQAEVLVFVTMNTSMHMTLRSPLDEEIVELEYYNFENFETFWER